VKCILLSSGYGYLALCSYVVVCCYLYLRQGGYLFILVCWFIRLSETGFTEEVVDKFLSVFFWDAYNFQQKIVQFWGDLDSGSFALFFDFA